MGISSWFNNKKRELRDERQLKERARQQAHIEAEKINTQRKIQERNRRYEEYKQKELYKRTTPKSILVKEQLQKVGSNLNKLGAGASERLERVNTGRLSYGNSMFNNSNTNFESKIKNLLK